MMIVTLEVGLGDSDDEGVVVGVTVAEGDTVLRPVDRGVPVIEGVSLAGAPVVCVTVDKLESELDKVSLPLCVLLVVAELDNDIVFDEETVGVPLEVGV